MGVYFYSIGKYLKVELLCHRMGICLTLQEIAKQFCRIIVCFIFPPAMLRILGVPPPDQYLALKISNFLPRFSGYVVMSHYTFTLHFPGG